MDCALHLLEQMPAEQLHYNLGYVAQNMQKDFVAEALKPNGRNLAKTVEQLYEKRENFDPQKVENITDFVNGFKGLKRITDEDKMLLDFDGVNNARFRSSLSNTAHGLCGIGTVFGTLFGVVVGSYLANYLKSIGYISQTDNAVPIGICTMTAMGIGGLGVKLSFSKLIDKLISGNQKPRQVYDFLHYEAYLADKYIELYRILEEKDFLNNQVKK